METDFTIFRKAPGWIKNTPKFVKTKKGVTEVAQGLHPCGILPRDLLPDNEIEFIKRMLLHLSFTQYNETDNTENVQVLGSPFVDSPSIDLHLNQPKNIQFYSIVIGAFNRLKQYFESMGFKVAPLLDSATGLAYSHMVARIINVPGDCTRNDGNICTVAHFDDWIRDAILKPDFRLPIGLTPNNFHQFSVCFPIDNGFYKPDQLEVYDYRYFPKDKEELTNWRVDAEKIKEAKKYEHIPQVNQPYFFNTQNVHDVRGGDSRSKRINMSIFFLYVPELNTLFPYN